MSKNDEKILVTLEATTAELDEVVALLREVYFRYGTASELFGLVYDCLASGSFGATDNGPLALCETARDAFSSYAEKEGEKLGKFVLALEDAPKASQAMEARET